jgi:hypothetical protein
MGHRRAGVMAGLLGLVATRAVAGPAEAGTRLCSYEVSGDLRACVRVSTPQTTVGGQVIVSGRLGRVVRDDVSVRDGVCLYRLDPGQRGTTVRPDQRLGICTYQYGHGRFRIPAYLGVSGRYAYVVGPRTIVAGRTPIVTPAFVVATSA